MTKFDPAEGDDNPRLDRRLHGGMKPSRRASATSPTPLVTRTKGMDVISQETGLSREQLYRSFSATGNPTLKTTIAVMKALGIALTAGPASVPNISTAAYGAADECGCSMEVGVPGMVSAPCVGHDKVGMFGSEAPMDFGI